MNKTLILAITIAVASFGCAEDAVETITTSSPAPVLDKASIVEETVTSIVGEKVVTDESILEDAMAAVAAADAALASTSEVNFENIDSNLDGVISITEAQNDEGLLTIFPDLDLDNTGDLSEVEYEKFTMLFN